MIRGFMLKSLWYLAGYIASQCIPVHRNDWSKLPIKQAGDYKMDSVHRILLELHSKILALQRVYRLVQSDKFQAAYDKVDEEARKEARQHINNVDREGLARWINYKLGPDIEHWSISELRELGQALSIRNYQYISKDVLIANIKHKRGEL